MKHIILGIAGIMMIGLIIGLIYYQNTIKTASLPQNPTAQNAQEQETVQEQPLHAAHTIDYSLDNDELNITFDRGESWTKVPIELENVFDGEYNGNKQELIDNSYILTESRVAFLYSDGVNWESKKIILTYSVDQGKTWEDTVVAEPFPAIRFRKVDFINDEFGYVIISGDRTMSQELSIVFLTHDGGKTWEETNNSGATRLISDGGFIDENTGFLSFGTINPQEPDVYVTQDTGDSWQQAAFHIPTKYEEIFVNAEIPVKEDDHLAVLVNQGPNGDYRGGEVKGKFVSNDNGETWDFSREVEPNETEE
ncbi:hypothetical protein JOC34_000776 [Virgibacillus halotolerans]|uniref:WD40/YVTN/BNR-like repeat-containing protein n=1 Tax=Virgibacillus halotolerans TaxID=1071053 RepID=UPI00195F7749|nr:oxidoreductase [Virgibacillus halotolerans]MBM7598419.1 hypothetical protein [Virgibacillus halotolerans]